MATISLKIKADAKKAKDEIKSFDQVTSELEKTFEKLQAEFKDKTIDKYATKINAMRQTMKATGDSTKALSKTKTQLKAAIQALIKSGVDPSDKRIRALSTRYRSLAQQTDIVTKKTRGMTVSLGGLVKSAAGIAGAFYAVRGIASSFSGAYNASRQFSKEIKNVTTLTDGLTFDQIKNGIKELNPILGNAADLTNGLYQAISAGVEPAKAISFVGDAARFAKAGLTDTNTAVDVITTALNAYGLEADKAGKVSDIFFKTIEKGKTTGLDLATNIGKSIPLFASAGVSLDELSAGLATLTLTGTNTAEATTQLNAIVNSFLKPSADMSRLLTEQGIASGGALLETQGLKGALDLLQKATGGNIDEMAKFVPNIRGLRGALGVLTQGGELYKETLDAIKDSTGATDRAFSKQVDAIDLATASVERAKLNFGDFLEGVLIKVAPVIENISNFIKDFDFDYAIAGLAGIAAAIVGIKIATLAVAGGMAAVQKAVMSLLASSGIGLIVLAVGALAVAAIYVVKNWDKVKLQLLIIFEKMKIGVSAAVTAIRIAFEYMRLGISKAMGKVKEVIFGTLANLIDKLGPLGKKLFDKMGISADGLRDKIGNVNDSVLKTQKRIEELKKKFEFSESNQKIATLRDELSKIGDAAADAGKKSEEMKKTLATIAPSDVPVVGGAVGGDGGSGLKSLTMGYEKFISVSAKAGEQAKADGQKISDSVSAMAGNARIAIDSSLGGISQFLESLVSGVENVVDIIVDKTKSGAEKIASAMAAGLQAVSGMVQGISGQVVDVIRSQNAWDDAADRTRLKKKLKTFDAEKKARIKQLEAMNLSDKDLAAKKEALEAETAMKKEEAEKEAATKSYDRQVEVFNIEKGVKIATIVINTAAAIMQGFAQLGPIAGAINAAVMGALGAVQIGLVAAQKPPPPPSFASGFENYIVPQGYDNDNYPVRARSGESVTVKPFGDDGAGGSGSTGINIKIGRQYLRKEIQGMIDNKEIVI